MGDVELVSGAPIPREPIEQLRDRVIQLLYCLGNKEHDVLTTSAMLLVRDALDEVECSLTPSLREKSSGRIDVG